MKVKSIEKISDNGDKEVTIQTFKGEETEEYTQVYHNNPEYLSLSAPEYRLLHLCWLTVPYYREIDKYGNKIKSDKEFINRARVLCKLEISALRKAFASLSSKQFLLKDQEYRGVYYLNPLYAFKGKLSDRIKLIKGQGL